ncbi:Carboxylesterase NlhH [Rubripirellula tenax]|uniref:Carboxylesterase NlhH n=1 Tax=Rubripirellula tenax TaxID=2528015 RepID=A0A5C6EF61_9BACT|nr:alpha/beta hydrolase [Rubripirellula tenax]TWU46331.1 Carboxylesterase NlhH [Rubripirellula tenax]
MFRIGLSIAMVFVGLACMNLRCMADHPDASIASTENPVEVEHDIVYGTGGGIDLQLDLARPIDRSVPSPCIVVIHGGAWRMGDKSNHRPDITALAEQGYVAATIQYRFCPEHQFPAQVEDVKCAVRYLRAHAEEYGIDPTRLGAVGYSAGAHLSMMLGTLDRQWEGDGGWPDQSSEVQAVVSYFGPTFFEEQGLNAQTKPLISDFLGGSAAEKPETYLQASPLTHVSPGDAPMLLFQGTDDALVPYQQAILMVEAMTKADIAGRVEFLIDAKHGWGGETRDRTNRETHDFFDQHLRTGG